VHASHILFYIIIQAIVLDSGDALQGRKKLIKATATTPDVLPPTEVTPTHTTSQSPAYTPRETAVDVEAAPSPPPRRRVVWADQVRFNMMGAWFL
jgi:hypothetical protein